MNPTEYFGPSASIPNSSVRTFDTGATRDSDDGKFDYEGFLSPLVLRKYAEYMHKHRLQSDGILRASDNWQNGIPVDQYMKSLWRHFMDLWTLHREHEVFDQKDGHQISFEEALCAVIFNSIGYLHEIEKFKKTGNGATLAQEVA